MDRDGQHDGDAVRFAPQAMRGQPWLQPSMPPWHLWGNTQRLTFVTTSFGTAAPLINQLCKVAYKRPDTWHWFFSAVLLQGPTPLSPQEAGVAVNFDLTMGLGRAMVKIPSFERFVWRWADVAPNPLPPLNQPIYSTSVYAPNRVSDRLVPPVARDNRIDELVGQDIQLEVRLESLSNFPGTIELEVSAFFAPKTHLRPDWYGLEVPIEAQFEGSETGGR